MRPCSIAFAAALLGTVVLWPPVQASAQDDGDLPLPDRIDRAFRDMMEGVKPKLDDALDYLRSFGAIDDPRFYEMPEVLPNGDIVIRRRDDAPDFEPEPSDEPRDPLPDDPLPPSDPDEGVRT